MFYQDIKISKETEFRINMYELGLFDTDGVNELYNCLLDIFRDNNINEPNCNITERGFTIVANIDQEDFIKCLRLAYIAFINNHLDLVKSNTTLSQVYYAIIANNKFDLYTILDYTYIPNAIPQVKKNVYTVAL